MMRKPYVVCHMLTSLDGKIDGAYMGTAPCAPALSAYGEIRKDYGCQATLYGTTTMAETYADGFASEIAHGEKTYSREDYIAPVKTDTYIISADPKGVLAFSGNTIEKKGRPKAHVVEILTEVVSDDYLAYLRSLDISYLFAGKEQIDCALLCEKLYDRLGIKRLMVSGGGQMNWSMARENLIDELSIVVAPVADGNTKAVSIFETAEFMAEEYIAAFHLQEAQAMEADVLWLRYTL